MSRLLLLGLLAGLILATVNADKVVDSEEDMMTTDNPGGCDDCSPTTEDLTSTTTTVPTTTPEGGLVCKYGASGTKGCLGGCFAILDNGVADYGCMGDLDFSVTVTECGDTEKSGQCNDYVDSNGETIESCMRCCDSVASCNEAYVVKCDFIPNDSSCKTEATTAGSVNLFASVSLLLATTCVVWFH